MRPWLLLLMPLFVTGAAEPAPDPAVTPHPHVASILEDLDGKVAKIVDVTASFTERKYTALLKKPLVSEGTVRVKGARALWETRRPHPSVVSLDPKRIRIFYPQRGALETFELSGGGGDRSWLNCLPIPRLDRLRASFVIEALPLETIAPGAYSDKRHLGLRLTPKDDSLGRYVERVSVVVDRASGCAVRAEMVDPDGDRTVIEFSGIRINSGLDEDDLDLDLPVDINETRPSGGISE